MSKKILVISGSPRKGGNSDLLADEFIRGAKEAGNQAEKILVREKKIKAVLDRTFALERLLTGKTFYLLSAGQAPSEEYMGTMIDSFRKYISCIFCGNSSNGKSGGSTPV